MAEQSSLAQRWQEYRPTKAAWLWSCVAAAILTMIVGFTWGGWVTGGTANSMAAQTAEDAREQLVASICVERFVNAPNASATFAKLKEASSWERDDIIEEGGWITIKALDEQITGAADVCAEELVAMEDLPVRAVEPNAAAVEPDSVGG